MTFASNLSPSQNQAIIDMGFGALLDVNLPQNDQSFSAWLMHCFEENSRTLYLPYNKSIVVCEEDVEVVYGIPRGEKEVKEVEDEEQEETPLTRWRKYWGVVSGSPKTHNVLKKYESEEEKEKKMEIMKAKMNKRKLEMNTEPAKVNNGEVDEIFIIDFIVLAEEFMEEFISVVRTMGENCEKLCEMIKHAGQLFPNNLLYKIVGDYMQKKLFGTDSFLNALDKVEKEYLEKVQAEKKAR
uniref:Uncharacterized protein n=1 Tax=Chenopodium quinoa TaxID=63459 RepID=A0A803LXS2_CHEQI